MIVTQTEYVNAKEIAEKIQRLPREAQRAVMNMLNGAVTISEMYRDVGTDGQPPTPARRGAEQDSA